MTRAGGTVDAAAPRHPPARTDRGRAGRRAGVVGGPRAAGCTPGRPSSPGDRDRRSSRRRRLGREPPATAVNTLQSYVSLLRRALGDPRHLRREGPGYVLSVTRNQLDATRFEDLVTAGRSMLAADPNAAPVRLDAAIDEWRGPALADVADEEWALTAVLWDELRLTALEARFDALLAVSTRRRGRRNRAGGRRVPAPGGLRPPADGRPLPVGAAGRRLAGVLRTRHVLSEQLGLDPTPELAELQTAILNHDPDLAAPPRAVSSPAAIAAAGRPPGAPRAGTGADRGTVARAPAGTGAAGWRSRLRRARRSARRAAPGLGQWCSPAESSRCWSGRPVSASWLAAYGGRRPRRGRGRAVGPGHGRRGRALRADGRGGSGPLCGRSR